MSTLKSGEFKPATSQAVLVFGSFSDLPVVGVAAGKGLSRPDGIDGVASVSESNTPAASIELGSQIYLQFHRLLWFLHQVSKRLNKPFPSLDTANWPGVAHSNGSLEEHLCWAEHRTSVGGCFAVMRTQMDDMTHVAEKGICSTGRCVRLGGLVTDERGNVVYWFNSAQ